MEFRILGSLEVRSDGRPLALAGPKERALLAILLLHANEVVSNDRLIDELWGDNPPKTGGAALQVRISALRRRLQEKDQRQSPSELLVTRAPGYLLRVEPDELDAARFERLVAAGRGAMRAGNPEVAAVAFRSALSLWLGDPLADLAYEPFAQAEIVRLAELRIEAQEERIEADLALGRHADVIGELEALVARHPLREHFCAQLMLALYRSGRQADALSAFRAMRHVLVEDLGIEPGLELQQLERLILLQDPELEIELAAPRSRAHDSATLLPERRKTVTIAVTEFQQQPDHRAIDPEQLRLIAERCTAAATRAYEQHGGVIEPPFGTTLVSVFGIPVVHEDDALRALRATASLGDALSGLSDELERDFGVRVAARIGIATGEVVTSAPAPGRPSVVGEPMILASQLQHLAGPGEIMLADSTRRMVESIVRVEPVELANSPSGWRLIDLGGTEPLGLLAPHTPLVGRLTELAQLRAAYDRATRDRTLHLCTILGPAGIGKSRLAQEFMSEIADRTTVVIGRCLAYGDGITFWPLREIVRQLAPEGDIAGLLAGDEDAELIGRRIAGAVGLTETAASVEETFWAVRRLFEAVARARPLAVVIEDIHWAEPTLLAMLEYLAVRTREMPILLLCLARPELLDRRPGFGAGATNSTSILLEPLAEDESQALMDDRLGSKRLDSETRARIHGTAEGNPLFLEQMVAMVTQHDAPSGELPVPPSVQALIAARIERLGPGEGAVLERAAVVGREFSRTAVAELLPEEWRSATGRHLDLLVAKDFLRADRSGHAGDEVFRFRHVLIQQAAYRSIPKQRRAETHEAIAGWLETNAEEGAIEIEQVVGYHLEQALRYRAELGPVTDRELDLARRAGERLAAAGRRAFRAGDMPASVNLLKRAAALLPSDDRGRLRFLGDLGVALFDIGAVDQASAVLGEAIALGRTAGDRAVEWSAIAKRLHVEMTRHPEAIKGEPMVHQAAQAIDALRAIDDETGLARAWLLMSDARWVTGRSVLAALAARRSVQHARRVGSRREESWAFGAYGYSLLFGSTPAVVGIRRLTHHLGNAEGAPVIASNLSGFLAAHEAMTGEIEAARKRMAPSRVLVRDLGLTWQTGTHDILSAFIESLAGDHASAEADLRSAFHTFDQMHDHWFLSIVTVNLAKVILDQGRADEASDLLDTLEKGVGDPDLLIRPPTVRARLLAAEGRLDEAETLARLAVAHAETTDFLGVHADAYVSLAEVLGLAGRRDEAVEALGSAIQLYERKGNTVEAQKARARRL